ncbi:acylphosphatase [Aestuariicoccus sp. MJ-SS9]|uniref:acylphosphatase n=1 Tax=Aestuariicoccus sp. MJ-SS9 TaxID=3079855 RepID=UPI0029101799|nr:acylphosphatase [Aestuariicoccus sp. MJ-SS9]MDU8912783.1 acylphosphatase [Aestuariicoccus sp. MJ-SS9]
MSSVRVVVRGRVQRVAFRAWTRREAEALGLRGWVRNRADGSVEAVLQGDAGSVEAMIARMREGPRAAHVTEVEAVPLERAEERFDGFDIRR